MPLDMKLFGGATSPFGEPAYQTAFKFYFYGRAVAFRCVLQSLVQFGRYLSADGIGHAHLRWVPRNVVSGESRYGSGLVGSYPIHADSAYARSSITSAPVGGDIQKSPHASISLAQEWVLTRLMENAERALQHVAVLDKERKPTGEYRYDGNVANRALELLGKQQGMFIDRHEVGQPNEFANWTDDELRAFIKSGTEALGIVPGKTQH